MELWLWTLANVFGFYYFGPLSYAIFNFSNAIFIHKALSHTSGFDQYESIPIAVVHIGCAVGAANTNTKAWLKLLNIAYFIEVISVEPFVSNLTKCKNSVANWSINYHCFTIHSPIHFNITHLWYFSRSLFAILFLVCRIQNKIVLDFQRFEAKLHLQSKMSLMLGCLLL